MKKISYKTPEEYYREAVRYYNNAKLKLKSARIEYDRYQDLKPVREACGTCYLAALLALDGYFLQRGLDKEKLPTSIDEYQRILNKLLVHDGKIRTAFLNVYEILHIWGYYRGIGDIDIVKKGFEKAKIIIETLSSSKL
jgi:hypothetical protein